MAAPPGIMSKEMNAPVLPESRKVNAVVVDTFFLTGQYNFHFNAEFIDAIQMNRLKHSCNCSPLTPVVHFCCPGCLAGRYKPLKEDKFNLRRVLREYKFRERDPVRAVDQILDLMIQNFPLALYAYGKGHQAVTNRVGITTLFFADIDSIHRFAGHIIHACEDYYYHEEYLHTVYHDPMYDLDGSPIKTAHGLFGDLQVKKNRLHDRLMMSYLGGGVGVGYIEPRTQEVIGILMQDCTIKAPHGTCGAYLAAERGTPLGEYKAKRYLLVPHGPIDGEVVKWSSKWIGGALGGGNET